MLAQADPKCLTPPPSGGLGGKRAAVTERSRWNFHGCHWRGGTRWTRGTAPLKRGRNELRNEDCERAANWAVAPAVLGERYRCEHRFYTRAPNADGESDKKTPRVMCNKTGPVDTKPLTVALRMGCVHR